MKEIILKELVLNGFKGKKISVKFGDKHTTISGRNAAGKSTIKNSFNWLTTGYDEFNIEKNHELFDSRIEHTKENSQPISVEGFFSIREEGKDPQDLVLKRTAKIGWVQKRGSTEYTRKKSNDYEYHVNEAPVSATEYSSAIEEYFNMPQNYLRYCIDINLFRDYAKKDWRKARKDLEFIIGEVKDSELTGDYTNLNKYRAKYPNLTIPQIKDSLKEKKKKFKDELEALPKKKDSKIEELPNLDDIPAAKERLSDLDEQISHLEDKSGNLQSNAEKEALDKLYKDLADARTKKHEIENAYNKEVSDLKSKKDRDFHTKSKTYKAECDKLIAEHNRQTEHLNSIDSQIKSKELQINKNSKNADDLNKEISKLRSEWSDIHGQKPEPTCSKCGADLKGDKKDDYLKFFKKNKDTALSNIQTEAKSKQAKHDSFIEDNESLTKEIEDLRVLKNKTHVDSIDKDAMNKEYNHLKDLEDKEKEQFLKELENPTPLRERKDYRDVDRLISNLNAEEENIRMVSAEAVEDSKRQKRELHQKRDECNLIIAKETTYNNIQDSIKKIDQEIKKVGEQKAFAEKLEDEIAAYEREKASITIMRVNNLFSYTNIAVLKQKKDGEWEDTCEVTDKTGVWGTNKATRGIIGTDISVTFAKVFNVAMPVFIDEIEGINKLPEFDTQTISLETNHSELSIDNGEIKQ